jgi:hypothetical protein
MLDRWIALVVGLEATLSLGSRAVAVRAAYSNNGSTDIAKPGPEATSCAEKLFAD